MRNHTYTFGKGYADSFKGQAISWPVGEIVGTPTQAQIDAAGLSELVGEGKPFDSIQTFANYANAQLNIKKGHAVQDATKEVPTKDENGKTVGRDGSKLTLADLSKIALEVRGTKSERARGEGSVKARAEKHETAKKVAAEKAKTYSPEQLKVLADLGMLPAGVSVPQTSGKK